MLEEGIIEFIKNNKKYFLLGFSLIIIIISAAVFLGKKPPPQLPPPWPTTYPDESFTHYPLTAERCKSVKDPLQKEKCFEDLKYLNAVWEKNVNKCLELKDDKKRDQCIFLVVKALSVWSVKDCEKIKDEILREECIIEAGIESLNDRYCEKFFSDEPFEKKECLDKIKAFDILRNTQNPSEDIKKCQEVKTLEYGTLCFRGMLQKINYDCDKLDGEQKDLCQSLVMKRAAKTIEDCQKIPLENYRKVCIKIIETGKSGFELDSDNDGKSDEGELFYATLDPFNPDTDGDGLLDGEEILQYHTDPTNPDSDGDGINDFEEIKLGKNPNKID